MNFIYLDSSLNDVTFDLEFLKRSSQRKNILLYQNEGVLAANNRRLAIPLMKVK